jgi:sec-independent protein translocase protein TatA
MILESVESVEMAQAGMIGAPQVIIILVIVLLLFGGKKIPELMKGLGKGMKEFKSASKGETDDKKSNVSDDTGKTDDATKSEG